MKRISLILLILFCATAPEAQAESSQDTHKRFELFTGCAPIGLVVEEIKGEYSKKIKLTRKEVINSVESRLRASRIFKETSFYYLYVNVNMSVGNSFNISLRFNKPVRDYYFPELSGRASSWQVAGTGAHGGDANFILSGISKYTDEFLVEYFRVNEEACNKIR